MSSYSVLIQGDGRRRTTISELLRSIAYNSKLEVCVEEGNCTPASKAKFAHIIDSSEIGGESACRL